ncbi:MAG: hypothetical protein ACOC1F_12985, partial [Myxococcota bacterium]
MRKGQLVIRGAGLAAVAFGWLVAASCSANSDGSEVGNGGGGSGAGGGSAGTGGGIGDSGGVLNDASFGDGTLDEAGACAGQSYPGKLAPLDVYVLLDATASMAGANDKPVVWPSVTAALKEIASDPMSTGIGIGLTFLPTPPPDGFHIPGSCSGPGDAACNGLGNCGLIGPFFACNNACQVDTDCGLYGPCVKMPGLGNICNGAVTKSVSCDPTDYGQPVVPI